MPLPGTELANKVLEKTGLKGRLFRHYTYKRASDRSYKMWGSFSEKQAHRLTAALKDAGASNPRVVYNFYGVSGVRFELN